MGGVVKGLGVGEMFEGAGCVVWIPAFAGMTEGVWWDMWCVEGWRGVVAVDFWLRGNDGCGLVGESPLPQGEGWGEGDIMGVASVILLTQPQTPRIPLPYGRYKL